jgi:hypothetical protein
MLLLRLLLLLFAGYAMLLALARLAALEERVDSLVESHELVLQNLLRSEVSARAARVASCEATPHPLTEGPLEGTPRGGAPDSPEEEDETSAP